jgi:hypothetical protein
VALTKRSDRVIVDLVDLVAPFKARGLKGSAIEKVGFEVLEASRRNWESSKVVVDVVTGFDVEVWGEMVIELAASNLAGDGLCDVSADGSSTKGELFNT